MLKKNIKKILAILMLLIIAISNMQGIVMAKEIGDSAKLVKIGDCNLNVQFKFDSGWSDIKGHYIGYSDGGNIYPAYCISHGLDGVDEIGSYSVDLTKILDDERVYRVVINGFPYKTPSQLGVADDYDAYLATKQAIYCVLLGRDVRAVYRGKNNSGNRVVDAIESLTHIGRYGSQRFNKPNISISRVGDLVEKENTYEQEFNVSSDIQISNYGIVATANMPEGAYIADTSGNSNTNFNAGNNFKMIIPKSSMDKDLNATLNITTRCKTYPVFFGKTNISGSQNYAITTDPYGDYAAKTNLNVKTNTGVIKIVKTDDETHKAIEGVTFQLSKEDGTVIANATTNKEGIATFSSLYRGKYILKETATNEKYILNTNEFNVDVEYNKTSTLNIENEHKKGNVKVYKIDKDNNRVVLGNVEFQLYSHEFEKVIGTYYTDVDGELYIENLRIGDYSLIETKTNKWYNLADDTDVKIEWNLTKELQIENELKKGSIKIIKVDKEDNEVKLKNVKFNVMDKDGNLLEELITDENGEAQTSRYAIREFSELKVQEVETLENYVLDDKINTIVLEANQIKDITFENEKIYGNITLTKIDKDYPENKLTGAIFKVYEDTNKNGTFDEEDKYVSDLLEDEEKIGVYNAEHLEYGRYFVKEEKAPEYFNLDENVYEVFIKENGKTYSVENVAGKGFANELQKGNIKIIKTSEDNKVKGFTFKITGKDIFGNEFSKEFKTDKNGEIFIENLRIGTYTIEEVSNDKTKNYIIPEAQTIEVKNGETIDLSFYNKLIEVPKTGDNSNIKLLVGIIILASLGLTLVIIRIYKKSKEDK